MFALRENINLFYPPAKFTADDVPRNVRLRAGGCVEPGSVKRDDTTLKVQFSLTDGVGPDERLVVGLGLPRFEVFVALVFTLQKLNLRELRTCFQTAAAAHALTQWVRRFLLRAR